MTNEPESFSTAIDELGSADLGESALQVLLVSSFLAPEEIPGFFFMEMLLSEIFDLQNETTDFEEFQDKITRQLKARGLLNYDESGDSFTMPFAVGEIVQSRKSFDELKEFLHLTYFSLAEFPELFDEEFEEHQELYIRHISHALQHNEKYRHACEHSATLFFHVGYDALENERYDRAVEFFKQALAATENEFEISNTVAAYKTHIARAYELQEKYDEAIRFYEESLAINKQIYGDESSEHADSLNSLALAFYLSEDFAKAAELLARTIELQAKIFGENASEIVYSSHNLALAYEQLDEYKNALVCLEKASKIYETAEVDDDEYLEKLQEEIETCRKKLAE